MGVKTRSALLLGAQIERQNQTRADFSAARTAEHVQAKWKMHGLFDNLIEMPPP
jgi:hypothetical protein